jgi:hypothetical protein
VYDRHEADTFRTMFMFSPPPEQPQGWSLTFEAFTEALRAREAKAPVEQRRGAFCGGDTLSFVVTTATGNTSEGMAVVDPDGVSIEDCNTAEAAEFAYWLQTCALPPEGRMQVNVTEGVEWELPAIELPRADERELNGLLTDRLRQILDHEQQQLG